MRRLASWCVRHRRITVLGWVAALVVCVAGAAGAAGATFKSNFSLPSSDSERALDLLKHRFPGQSGDSATIVVHTTRGTVTQPAIRARVQAMFARVAGRPHVRAVVSPFAPARVGRAAISSDGRTSFGTVQFDRRAINLPRSAVLRVIDTARGAGGNGLQVELGGQTIQNAQRTDRQGASEGIALLAAIVVLLLTFGSVVAMGLPCVFGSFALGNDLTVKLFGIGLATAVFLDAFVIRTALVPAIMELLGARAWWLPRRLHRVLPRVGVEPSAEAAVAPVAEPRPERPRERELA